MVWIIIIIICILLLFIYYYYLYVIITIICIFLLQLLFVCSVSFVHVVATLFHPNLFIESQRNKEIINLTSDH